jgi:N utilization substance protein B
MSHYEEITDIISKATEGYVIKRIYKVDLAILVDAIYEIKYLNEPVPVIINEAVELAKKYSNEKSPSFINGVLSKIVNK